MPEIVVIDPSSVTIDGVASGPIADVLVNHDPGVTLKPDVDGGFRGDFQAALVAWHDGIQQAHADAVAALNVTIADQQSLIDTLGGTDLGRQMAAEAKRQEILAAQAKLAAELAALGGSGT